jgi:phospholipid/cholesterol/gamma-HCH transport system substrate-binding protein
MAHRDERQMLRVGVITMMVVALALTAVFNLKGLPGLHGTTYHADLTDASGLKIGDRVEVAGIRVGQVDGIHIEGAHVVVDFDVTGVQLGSQTSASVEVLDLLGQKYLHVTPEGTGTMASGSTIPVDRTSASYDLVGTLDTLTKTTGQIRTHQLAEAFDTLSGTLDQASPQIRGSLDGMARLSQTIASNDAGLNQLLTHAQHVIGLIDRRKTDMVGLIHQGDQVFTELIARREAVHQLLVESTALARQLSGLANDNQRQIAPALSELHQALGFLNARKHELDKTIDNYGPYVSILMNTIGTGPWFDAYVPNLVGLGSGEFTTGHRPGMS